MNRKIMKGISPLIAAVLLIAITVTIATLVSGWISTVTRTTQIAAENKTTEAVECAAAAISVDQVYMVGNRTVRVVVRNSGQANDLVIANVSVINSTGSVFTFPTAPALTNFDRGDSYTFLVDTGTGGVTIGRTCPADFSKVIVTTNCGGVASTFDKTPRCLA